MRRDPEIEYGSIEIIESLLCEHRLEMSEVRSMKCNPGAEACRRHRGVRIAVESHYPGAGKGVEERRAVPPSPECRIHDDRTVEWA